MTKLITKRIWQYTKYIKFIWNTYVYVNYLYFNKEYHQFITNTVTRVYGNARVCSSVLLATPMWLEADVADNWKLPKVVNSHLVCDPTIWQLGFDLPWQPFSRGTGTLRCLQKSMATCRHWSVSLWRDSDDVQHCQILSSDKAEWWFISATLCGWRRCFVADQLWFMTCIREEED